MVPCIQTVFRVRVRSETRSPLRTTAWEASINTENFSLLNGKEIDNVADYSYLGATFYLNGKFSLSKQRLIEKVIKKIDICMCEEISGLGLDLNKLPISMCNKLFPSNTQLYSPEVWGANDSLSIDQRKSRGGNEKRTALKGFKLNFTNISLV